MASSFVISTKNIHFLVALWHLVVLLNSSCGQTQHSGNSTTNAHVLPKQADTVQTAALKVSKNKGNNASIIAFESSLTVITHHALPNNKLFCRIKGACRVGDGTVLLPQWMRSYSAHLSNCGFRKVVYSLTDVREELGDSLVEVQGVDIQMSLRDDFRDFDILGNEPPRGERNLLVGDITPVILLLDLFQRQGAYSKAISSLCATKHGNPCKTENGSDPASFKPMVLVDSRVSDTKDYMWPKSLLRLLRNSVAGNLEISDLKDLYSWQVRSRASCFRSLISTNVRTADILPTMMMPSNIFFSKNSLVRTPVGRSLGEKMCSVKVLILNRYGKRFIEGSEKLRTAISALARKVQKIDDGVLIQPEVVFFENSSFHEQVSVMQEASVVVASHGDGNANFVFLRPRSRVFEILPFGFSSDLYSNLSKAYGSVHSYVWGQPDYDVFLACVNHFNPVDSPERQAFISRWQDSATKFSEETVRRNANIPSEYIVPEDDDAHDQELQSLRQCASYQRITVHVKHLAKLVTKAAADHCQVQGDLNFLKT